MRRITMSFDTSRAIIGTLCVLLAGAAVAQPQIDEVQRSIVQQTNRFRVSQGLAAVKPSPLLERTAQAFAAYMARTDRYGHDADGRTPPERAQAQGYDYCLVAENIAYEFSSADFATQDLAQRFERGWEQSPPHRANMLDRDAAEIGVAVAQSPTTRRYYAVQMFGRTLAEGRQFEISNKSSTTVAYEFEGKRYSLSPRTTRTHRVCRLAQIAMQLPGRQEPSTFTPANGERYVVSLNNGRVDLAAH